MSEALFILPLSGLTYPFVVTFDTSIKWTTSSSFLLIEITFVTPAYTSPVLDSNSVSFSLDAMPVDTLCQAVSQ